MNISMVHSREIAREPVHDKERNCPSMNKIQMYHWDCSQSLKLVVLSLEYILHVTLRREMSLKKLSLEYG